VNRHYLSEAAFFRDIGRLDLQRGVLRKRRLTVFEKRLIRKHPEIGALIMKGHIHSSAYEAILNHHEGLDETEYPGSRRSFLPSTIIAP
jgi:HD-GYP domain-containing protein (c-di-GMP phosphodiesterase class II)